MKILVFVERFMSPTLMFIYNEIQELSKTNEVLVLTSEYLKENEKDFPFKNIKVIPYTINRIKRKANWILERNDIYFNRKDSSYAKKINRLIESFKPDIIHGHFGYESLILFENLKPGPYKVFVSFHGYDASQMLKRICYIKKLAFHFKRLNITPLISCHYLLNAMKAKSVPLENAKVLYYGINTEYYKPDAQYEKSDKTVFLQVSSFQEKKGHIYTLQAFKKFLDSVEDKGKYTLILGGGGALLEPIKSEAMNLGIDPFVEFTGWINYKQILPLLQKADIFVHHSVTASNGDEESTTTTVMEAMALELPVISTLHAGIPEIMEDGVNGYLVKEKDIDTYAKRMTDSLSWGHQPKNRQKVKDLFSNETHKKNLENIYSGN